MAREPKFSVNEEVYYTAFILADRKIIKAVKKRKLLRPLYLVTDKDTEFLHWEPESKLTKIA